MAEREAMIDERLAQLRHVASVTPEIHQPVLTLYGSYLRESLDEIDRLRAQVTRCQEENTREVDEFSVGATARRVRELEEALAREVERRRAVEALLGAWDRLADALCDITAEEMDAIEERELRLAAERERDELKAAVAKSLEDAADAMALAEKYRGEKDELKARLEAVKTAAETVLREAPIWKPVGRMGHPTDYEKALNALAQELSR